MISMYVPMLQRHITNAVPISPHRCPVYKALKDALPDKHMECTIHDYPTGASYDGVRIQGDKYRFNSIGVQWMKRFDSQSVRSGYGHEDMPEMILKVNPETRFISGVHGHDFTADFQTEPPSGWFLQLRETEKGTKSFVYLSQYHEDYSEDKRATITLERNFYTCWHIHFDPFAWTADEQDLDVLL